MGIFLCVDHDALLSDKLMNSCKKITTEETKWKNMNPGLNLNFPNFPSVLNWGYE